jgi:hypothetical protein
VRQPCESDAGDIDIGWHFERGKAVRAMQGHAIACSDELATLTADAGQVDFLAMDQASKAVWQLISGCSWSTSSCDRLQSTPLRSLDICRSGRSSTSAVGHCAGASDFPASQTLALCGAACPASAINYRRQNCGVKSTISDMTSSRPSTIVSEHTHV